MQSGLEFLTFLFASLDQSLTKLRKQSYGFPLKFYYVFVSLFDTVQILILIISKPNVQIKANK
jgi:type III secretory pathway component EscS